MTKTFALTAMLSPLALLAASCNATESVETASENGSPVAERPFTVSEHGSFAEPWAVAVHPQTGTVFITEKAGTMKFVEPASGRMGTVTGLPRVDYGGQGGLGDFVFAPDFADTGHVYLSWAEAGDGDTRGAAVGRGTLVCEEADACRIDGLEVIWRQAPKVTGRGHYSHRIAFSPDGQYLFIASGDRQKLEPAQDLSNTLGTVVRLNLDGTPAAGNPFADRGSPSDQIWSYGHRNILGLQFAPDGSLWDLEHGPAGGDELNQVERAANYGWPVVSDGQHYNGDPIPDHATRPEFKQPAIGWSPVIAPGDFIFYTGDAFPDWQGDALIVGLRSKALVHVDMDRDPVWENARYDFDTRLRDIAQGRDGSLWIIEDGDDGRLLRLAAN